MITTLPFGFKNTNWAGSSSVELSQSSFSVQYRFHLSINVGDPSSVGFVLKPSTRVVTNGLRCTDYVSEADTKHMTHWSTRDRMFVCFFFFLCFDMQIITNLPF